MTSPDRPNPLRSAVRTYLGRHPALRGTAIDLLRSGRFALRQPGAAANSFLHRVKPAPRLVQAPLELATDLPSQDDSGALLRELQRRGLEVLEGSHTLYIPPQPLLSEVVADIDCMYPPDTGLKILRNFGPPKDTHYLSADTSSTVRRRLIGRPWDQLAAANLLQHNGLGAECCDLIALHAGETVMTAFAVEHVPGRLPAEAELRDFRDRLASLTATSPLRIALGDWTTHDDFLPPHANNNLLVRDDGSMAYVDFQNFYLADPFAWTRDVLDRYGDEFHFGDRRLLRERLLYQSIPGLRLAAKRDTQRRWRRLDAALTSCGIDLRDRFVLDIGCNSAMLLLEALANGARWVLGWDTPKVAEGTRELLASLGATRHTITGEMMTPSTDLVAAVPPRLRDGLSGSVVFYLAVHHHVGVLESLRDFDWEALVFEGHQDESDDDIGDTIAPLVQAGARIAADYRLADGKSSSRRVLILLRDRDRRRP